MPISFLIILYIAHRQKTCLYSGVFGSRTILMDFCYLTHGLRYPFMHSFIHSFHRCLGKAHYMPGTVICPKTSDMKCLFPSKNGQNILLNSWKIVFHFIPRIRFRNVSIFCACDCCGTYKIHIYLKTNNVIFE